MPRPKQRTALLREHVLEVAVRVLENDGVPAFTTRAIAQRAGTSTPAVYELFGDKAGLVRSVYFEGFRLLRDRFDRVPDDVDGLAALTDTIRVFRDFRREHPALSELMFSRPFSDTEPGSAELAAAVAVQRLLVDRVGRCVEQGQLAGDPVDLAHVLVSLAQGLAVSERTGLLGSSTAALDRRWTLAVTGLLTGLRPGN